jgi:hypothetical protein
VLVFQGAATDKIADDHAALPFLVVFEADCYHSVSGYATSPAIVAIFLADFPCCNQFEITVCTYVVVATVAFKAVVASVGSWNWVGADVTVC